jgi:hypothetical protein
LASWVPLRPSKLRLKVRALTPADTGEPPMRMHGPQVHSRSRAPASRMGLRSFSAASILTTCLEPGEPIRSVAGGTRLPLRVRATVFRSAYEEFVQEPTAT